MIDPNDIDTGKKYFWLDEDELVDRVITIVGKDPYTSQWVAACEDWVMGISHLDEGDFRLMRRI